MTQPWYDYSTSQGYGQNGETGIDIATPFHTAVSLLFGGTVKSATYEPWGGDVEVVSNIPGLGEVTQYMIHLDEIAPGIVPGAHITAGQYIGLSGGENAGYPGAEHPAEPRFSTGPHVEWGLKTGQGSTDPTQFIDKARAGALGDLGNTTTTTTPPSGTVAGATQSLNAGDIGGVLGNILKAIGIPQLPPWQDIAGVTAGIALIGVAAALLIREVTAPAQEDAQKVIEKVAEASA